MLLVLLITFQVEPEYDLNPTTHNLAIVGFHSITILQPSGNHAANYLRCAQVNFRAAELTLFAVDEDYVNAPDNQFIGPGFFLKYEREIHKGTGLRFYHKNYAIMDAGDGNKRLWHSWTGLRIPLYGRIVGSAQCEIDYDNQPALRRDSTDTTFRLKLGYQW